MPASDFIEGVKDKDKNEREIYGLGHYLKIKFDHGNFFRKSKTMNLYFELLRPSETTSKTNNQSAPQMIEEIKNYEERKGPELVHSDSAAAASQPNANVAANTYTANTADTVAAPGS